MEYRRVGRGGAGNYYSKQEVEKASKTEAQNDDIEAQRPSQIDSLNQSSNPQSKYATYGRGGAGNWVETSDRASAATQILGEDPVLDERSTPTRGYSGRGGAGNFRDSTVIEGRQPQDRELQEMKRTDSFQDVEAGLQAPQQAHLGGEKLKRGS
ncbi:uncharacterized protein KY384_001047 [Bacidia gigantensis]|uniref:uncharacterized protein n=1 Tax=Bacidia gigantensis TaxID=2732470 RepID=UPI001D0580C3|nr:uncharacterized protein KY384_001047 [Bacidia gigantensis]KAG8534203.1 hypothetical protein KY384_001047 [Bacidia gigantensis]